MSLPPRALSTQLPLWKQTLQRLCTAIHALSVSMNCEKPRYRKALLQAYKNTASNLKMLSFLIMTGKKLSTAFLLRPNKIRLQPLSVLRAAEKLPYSVWLLVSMITTRDRFSSTERTLQKSTRTVFLKKFRLYSKM